MMGALIVHGTSRGALQGLKTIIIIQENWDGHNSTTSTDALLIAK